MTLMKKFLILLSAGTAFAFASCASHSHDGDCCGSCGGGPEACCSDDSCEKCKAE